MATPAAARGLDLPEVSLVLSAGAPADATDYLHRAGRAGRIGATTPGALRPPKPCTLPTASTGPWS